MSVAASRKQGDGGRRNGRGREGDAERERVIHTDSVDHITTPEDLFGGSSIVLTQTDQGRRQNTLGRRTANGAGWYGRSEGETETSRIGDAKGIGCLGDRPVARALVS